MPQNPTSGTSAGATQAQLAWPQCPPNQRQRPTGPSVPGLQPQGLPGTGWQYWLGSGCRSRAMPAEQHLPRSPGRGAIGPALRGGRRCLKAHSNTARPLGQTPICPLGGTPWPTPAEPPNHWLIGGLRAEAGLVGEGIEAGCWKWLCGVANWPLELLAPMRFQGPASPRHNQLPLHLQDLSAGVELLASAEAVEIVVHHLCLAPASEEEEGSLPGLKEEVWCWPRHTAQPLCPFPDN
eukprot:1329757-Lingulodinium_polyedra.AAC.1